MRLGITREVRGKGMEGWMMGSCLVGRVGETGE